MNKSTLKNLALGLVVVALSLAPVVAQTGDGPHGRGAGHGPAGGPGMMARMADELDLTAEQRTKIREITAKYMGGALGGRMDAMRQARQKLQAVVHDPLATDAQVEEAAKAISSEVVAAAVERHRMASEISAVLTPEQRQKAAELRRQAREGRGGRRGDGPHGGGPDWF